MKKTAVYTHSVIYTCEVCLCVIQTSHDTKELYCVGCGNTFKVNE